MIKKYRNKQVEVEAVAFDGANGVWIQQNFCSTFKGVCNIPTQELSDGTYRAMIQDTEFKYWIQGTQGDIIVSVGDYIIKGETGQFYCCDSVEFKSVYQEIK